MTANFSYVIRGFGKLTFLESNDEIATLLLTLEGAFDACAIYEALDCLTVKHSSDFEANPIKVTLEVKVGGKVRNPEGFTKMWARRIRETAEAYHNDYLRSIEIVEVQPETVRSSCPHCSFHEERQFPGGNMKALDAIGAELFDLHMANSPECPYFPTWC